MQVVMASSNPGKLHEALGVLHGSGIELTAGRMRLGHEETGDNYHENAWLKATAALRLTGQAVLAEDAGLEVDALHGAPGHRSARFAGPAASDDANNAKLLRLLSGVPDAKRTARFRAVAVLLLPDGRSARGEGVFEGSIGHIAAGSNGFGYDPLFYPAGKSVTVAELDDAEKNALSHRGRALRQLVNAARRDGLL